MSGLGLKCLELTAGLIADKMRKTAASSLKGGDVTDESFRVLLLKEVEVIREQLDGLSRVDLLAAVNFFKEGMELLYTFIKSSKAANMMHAADFYSAADGKNTAGNISTLLVLFGEENCANATVSLMKQKFQLAGEYSTKAFSNESLDIEDRVTASSLRIHATLLGNLDNPDVCVVLLKSYIEQLNSISGVVNAFEVQFSPDAIGIMKKIFKSDKRRNLVRSVVAVNRVAYDYVILLTKSNVQSGSSQRSSEFDKANNWLCIKFGDIGVNLITDARVRKLCRKVITPDESLNNPQDVAVNSSGMIIVADTCNHKVKFFTSEGTYLDCCDDVPDPNKGTNTSEAYNTNNFWPTCVDVDQDDNIYVASSRRRREERNLQSEIVVFNRNGKFLHRFEKNTVLSNKSILTSMSLDIHGRLLVVDDHEDVVLVFSADGKFLFKFGSWHTQEDYSHVATMGDGTIAVTLWNHVNIYDKELGKCIKTIPMSDHGLPIAGITYDPHTEQATILSKSYKHLADRFHTEETPNLQVYSKDWELLSVVFLPDEYHNAKGIATTFDGFVIVANVAKGEVLIV